MKKRLFTLLLCLSLVFALFCGMSSTAYADGTVNYTMKAGDTMIGICQKLGIDFYANQAWILANNNIANFNDMKVGTVLTLPTSKTAAAAASAVSTVAAPAATTAAATGSYYLIEHVMQAGETVYSVCNQLGIDFNANSEKIKSINGIANYNNVKVGQIVKFPSTAAPAGGNYSTVTAYVVQAGDTVGAICNRYGIDYGKNAETIKSLSGVNDLSVIRVGQTLYLPASGSAVPAAATGTATTVPTTVSTKPVAGNFNVHTSSNGVFTLQANGQIINSAAAGTTVNVVAVPDPGYKVNQIIVYETATTNRVPVSKSSFVMPSHDITIYVTFKIG